MIISFRSQCETHDKGAREVCNYAYYGSKCEMPNGNERKFTKINIMDKL